MENIRVGVVGLGGRGKDLMGNDILPQGEKVVAVCDLYEDRVKRGIEIVEAAGQETPAGYTCYKDLIADENVTVVVIASTWESHIEIAIAAMKAGKAVAMEVGGAYTVEQCWDLVNTQEETGVPFMFLENCCFGRREMQIINMVKQGFFGEIVHCTGAYMHDLVNEVGKGREIRHYRLRNYLTRNCENYPTHEMGPIARVLNLNHGNRMMTLTSTASKAVGMREWVRQNRPDDEFLKDKTFAQGDIVTTVIKCAKGETIHLTLDTTLPRYYSRNFSVRGTKGFYEEVTDSIFLDRREDWDREDRWRELAGGNAKEYEEEYDDPVWKKHLADGAPGGHDGIDWLEFEAFFKALRNDEPMPVDVYDAASWMVITALSEQSIALGGAVMYVPDFTKGKWMIHECD